jgi:germination protein M
MRHAGIILNTKEYNKKQRSRFLVLFLVVAMLAVITYFFLHQKDVTINTSKLYFFDSAKQELVPISRKIELNGTMDKIIKVLIENLSLVPEKTSYLTYIPAYTKVKSVSMNNEVCTVTFEPTILTGQIDSVLKESATVYSIVNTLTEIPQIKKVKIVIEGKKDPYFQRYVSIQEPLVRLTGQLPKGVKTLLYFYHNATESYAAELREIPVSTDLATEATHVVNQLMIGPKQSDLTSYFPQGVKILKATVEDGICTIDFSKEIRRFAYGAEEELIIINLIALSVTELSGIERVAFLIEGKEVYTLAGHASIKKPIQRWYGTPEHNCILFFTRKSEQVSLYQPSFRTIPDKIDPTKVLTQLFAGPTAKEKEDGCTTDVPTGTKLNAVNPKENNELIVDLSIELNKFANAVQEENFLRQIIMTITENTSFTKVMIYVNGKSIESLPFGTDISKFLTKF